jgi:methylated-DNA-[protein]-cysteine S-methyltransferase
MLEYKVFDTSLGWVGIISSSKGLVKSCLPKKNFTEVMEFIKNQDFSPNKTEKLDELSKIVIQYLDGIKIDLSSIKIDYYAKDSFKNFWKTCRKIPFGETRTYKWLAQNSNKPKAYRYAGLSMAKNPLPLFIPCHRVISSDGNIGGFQGGNIMKKKLIDLERKNTIS